MPIAPSELILNDDGSIYHLNLKPGDLATTIITVGDQERVHEVSKHFDSIEVRKQKREFTCHTGYIGSKRLSVISTGIGTDNIDIVFNEIDALFNVDLSTREVKSPLTQLTFVRIGTSGAVQENIELGSFLISGHAIGIDNMNVFYSANDHAEVLSKVDQFFPSSLNPYVVSADKSLVDTFKRTEEFTVGRTITSIGFYGPQGRAVRVKPEIDLLEFARKASVTNLEMETSGIYLLAGKLGHRAISLNAILANRVTNEFTERPDLIVEDLIKKTLSILTTM